MVVSSSCWKLTKNCGSVTGSRTASGQPMGEVYLHVFVFGFLYGMILRRANVYLIYTLYTKKVSDFSQILTREAGNLRNVAPPRRDLVLLWLYSVLLWLYSTIFQ